MLLPFWVVALAVGDAAGIELGAVPFRIAAAVVLVAAVALGWWRRGALGGGAAAVALGLWLGHRAAAPPIFPWAVAAALEGGEPATLEAHWVRLLIERGGNAMPARALLDLTSVNGTV